MQIVIDIDDEYYALVRKGYIIKRYPNDWDIAFEDKWLSRLIENGTPLPKGHGRLIDADALMKKDFPKADPKKPGVYNMEKYPYWKTDITGIISILDDAPTIIETDKEIENG